MTLIEGAPATVLSAEPDRGPGFEQACKGQSFSHPIINRSLACAHLGALLQQFADFGMNVKARREGCEPLRELRQFFGSDSCFDFILRFVAEPFVFVPVIRKLAQAGFLADRSRALLRSF